MGQHLLSHYAVRLSNADSFNPSSCVIYSSSLREEEEGAADTVIYCFHPARTVESVQPLIQTELRILINYNPLISAVRTQLRSALWKHNDAVLLSPPILYTLMDWATSNLTGTSCAVIGGYCTVHEPWGGGKKMVHVVQSAVPSDTSLYAAVNKLVVKTQHVGQNGFHLYCLFLFNNSHVCAFLRFIEWSKEQKDTSRQQGLFFYL